ncbi:MAG: heavy metal translocating P-type ATPase [Pseudomonadota bacterium]
MTTTRTSTSATTRTCFHCGQTVPDGVELYLSVNGRDEPMCCSGCMAVASVIQDAGLGRYYDFRDRLPERPVDERQRARFAAWDRDAVLDFHARQRTPDSVELVLVLENVHCPACAWLINHYLGALPGVHDARLTVHDGRLRLSFDPNQTPLSAIGEALVKLGYPPHLDSPSSDADRDRNERRRMLRYLIVAALGMMQVMSYALAKYIGAGSLGSAADMDPEMMQFFRLISMIVAVPVALYAGQPFYRSAWQHIQQRHLGLDIPVAAAMLIALFSSVLITLTGTGPVYFDSVVMFIFFLLLGRFAVLLSRQQSGALHSALARALPSQARRKTDDGVEAVGLIELAAGDVVLAADGDIIPADGRVCDGRGRVDEALLSGVSMPRRRHAGDAVLAGSVVSDGALQVRVEATGQATVLAGIVDCLSAARSQRPRMAALADRAAGWFIGLILIATGLAGAVWWTIDPGQVIPITLAMLVVACPCALALGTPTALASATRGLAERGVLTANPDALMKLSSISHVVLDKTGTLTRPAMHIAECRHAEASATGDDELFELGAALERISSHPIAAAFRAHDRGQPVDQAQSHASCGVSGVLKGDRHWLGRVDWVSEQAGLDIALPARGIWVALARRSGHVSRLLGMLRLDSPLRAGSRALVETLQQRGLTVIMASGDRLANVRAMAERLGIVHYQAEQRPEDKLALVHRLQAKGAVVAMVGDGINDAPVLAGADVSIALAEGAAIAQTQADLLVTGRDLHALQALLTDAPRVRRIIAQNLSWALAYNLTALPLAALGWIPPWAAAIGMSLSSLAVVLNARRLSRRARPPRPEAVTEDLAQSGAEADWARST